MIEKTHNIKLDIKDIQAKYSYKLHQKLTQKTPKINTIRYIEKSDGSFKNKFKNKVLFDKLENIKQIIKSHI